MNIIILENTIQEIETSSCGQFQLYFYKNLFDPEYESKILSHKKLTKQTLQTLTNEIFSTDINENKYVIKNLAKNLMKMKKKIVKSLLELCLDIVNKRCRETDLSKYWLNYGYQCIPFKFYQKYNIKNFGFVLANTEPLK